MVATLQPGLPQLAIEYQAAQSKRIRDALREINGRWDAFGLRYDAGWAQIRPVVLTEIRETQYDLAKNAAEFVPTFMEQTGQRIAEDGVVDPTALVGISGAGIDIGEELDWTPVRAKQAVAEGDTAVAARSIAQSFLLQKTSMILMDTSRNGERASMAAHRAGGFVRVVHGGACGRCVVLAGKWFKYNRGFLRHPRCHCIHAPASETMAGNWQSDPRAYFDSLNEPQQIKLMGSAANAQAVREGADISQVVNIYRRSSGLRYAQESGIKKVGGLKFTTEGTTRRGRAGQQQAGLRRNGQQQVRPTPETIAMRATSVEDRQRLMRLYGYIVDDAAAARGRAVFIQARRAERNERRRERRAAIRSTNNGPATAAGGSGSGSVPPRTPRSAAFGPEPDPRDRSAFAAYWLARQEALGIREAEVGRLNWQEVRFAERATDLGWRFTWLPIDPRHRSGFDFEWHDLGNVKVELKSPKARWETIRGRITDDRRDAIVNHGIDKRHYIVDLGAVPLSPELRDQLATYNLERTRHPIKRLWVMSDDGRTVEEIVLRKK